MQKIFCPPLLIALLFIAPAIFAQDNERYEKVAHRFVDLINSADYSGIEKLFSKEMAEALPLEKSKSFFGGMTAQFGKLQKLDEPTNIPGGKNFAAKFERGTMDFQLVLDQKDEVAGFAFRPRAESAPANQKTGLSLPFKDRWLVAWGGDTRELNQHHDTPNQRFAFDFLGADKDGKTRRGQSDTNEDYFAFGREVVAPADGTVIEVIDGVRDNAPGSMNPYSALGNCVVVEHGPNEVSLLAHLRRGSIAVKMGDQVKRGDFLGQCGNSGNSSEPHLHYHLQNSPIIQDGLGIKCTFQNVVVIQNGKTETKKSYSPVKGDIISPA